MRKRVSLVALPLLAGALFVGCAQGTAGKPVPTAGAKAQTCDAASLAMDPATVIATVEGQPVTAGDLGPELVAAEQKALREYCAGLAQNRQMALDNFVTERLVKKAAEKAGRPQEDWIKDQMAAKVGAPSDEEIQKFYDARKTPDAPPLEVVKPQVAQAIQREKAESAIRDIIADLKKGSAVVEKLPDVRPAPVDLSAPAYTAVGGKKGSKVQVVEFADFECPYCSGAADTMNQLKAEFGDKVEFQFRHFPLSFHKAARKAAEYAQCAGRQGKFWQFHDTAFQNQASLSEDDLKKYVVTAGADPAQVDQCVASGEGAKEVELDYQKGLSIGIEGTPSFFVNGRVFAGNPTFDGLKAAIQAELQKG